MWENSQISHTVFDEIAKRNCELLFMCFMWLAMLPPSCFLMFNKYMIINTCNNFGGFFYFSVLPSPLSKKIISWDEKKIYQLSALSLILMFNLDPLLGELIFYFFIFCSWNKKYIWIVFKLTYCIGRIFLQMNSMENYTTFGHDYRR